MKAKWIFFASTAGVLSYIMLAYTMSNHSSEVQDPRSIASAPANYESLKACEKQELLWQNVLKSNYQELPPFRKFGAFQLLAMSFQDLGAKGNHHSDFAPEGWKKLIHARGAIAKVKVVPKQNNYSGVFQGADCALLRLSITFRPGMKRGVAPGLALKVLRDGVESGNISALVSLDGQGQDYNYFRNPLSNIVPMGKAFGQKLVHLIFAKVSGFPEELLTGDLARSDSQGVTSKEILAPRQIFFVPGEGLSFSSDQHDVRDDFLTISEGTVIYHLYAVPEKYRNFDYSHYTLENAASFLKESEPIADLVTTSKFVTSAFGDSGIFFRHQLREVHP